MNLKTLRYLTLLAIAAVVIAPCVTTFAEPTPGFNNKISENIMTPDSVETRIGTLEFFDGMPSAETVTKVFDNLDFLRGVEVFLNGIPATSIEGLRLGMLQLGVKKSNHIMITDTLLDSEGLFLTGNTDTVYASGFLNLLEDGPMGQSISTLDQARRKATNTTGSRPFLGRAGFPYSASTVLSNPGSTEHGSPAILS